MVDFKSLPPPEAVVLRARDGGSEKASESSKCQQQMYVVSPETAERVFLAVPTVVHDEARGRMVRPGLLVVL